MFLAKNFRSYYYKFPRYTLDVSSNDETLGFRLLYWAQTAQDKFQICAVFFIGFHEPIILLLFWCDLVTELWNTTLAKLCSMQFCMWKAFFTYICHGFKLRKIYINSLTHKKLSLSLRCFDLFPQHKKYIIW